MDANEVVIKKFHPDPLFFLGFYVGGIVIIVLSLIFFPLLSSFGVLVIILGEVVRRAETFFVLESGIARGYRLLSTSRVFVEYEKIQNLEVSQSFLENIFGIGDIKIDTAGGDAVELSFNGIKDPYSIESIIRERIKK